MKRISSLIAVIAVASTLTSCGNKSKQEENSSSSGFQYAYLGHSYCGNGMIYSSDPVRFMDLDTMESTVLCAKPNCNHQSSECVGKLVGDSPIMYNGYLYYFTSFQKVEELGDGNREFRINSKLCRVSLDSSEVEEIVGFTDCVPRDYDGWIIKDDAVYFTGDNMNPTPDDYGNITTGNSGGIHYICSIDLKTKKYTNYGSVYDGDKEYEAASYSSCAQIKGEYNSQIMIRYSFRKTPYDRNEILQEGYDFRKDYAELMFEFDPHTKELKESNLLTPSYVDEDTYVYADVDSGKSYMLRDGQTYEFDCDTVLNAWYANQKLFVPSEGIWYDLEDMSKHSMGEYKGKSVVGYKDFYILFNDNKIIKLTEEELFALEKEVR